MKHLRFGRLFGRWLTSSALALALLMGSAPKFPAQTPAGRPPADDLDNDGLNDIWEFSQRALGLAPRKANLILVPVIRPNVTREEVRPTLDRVVDFFARVPNRNPDGTTGIGVVIQWGNALPDSDSDAPGRTPPPDQEVRGRGMPAVMIGKGHGVLIGAGRAGGGKTYGPDWSGVSNNWHAIVHEVGHQLGLDHEPKGTGIPSLLYTSLMNYDYSYQFNGDPNGVHFSTGKFSSLRLDERNLSETLPFPIADLSFLSREPYNLRLQDAGGTTNIDFNRNGVFGEGGLRVDVNGGSGVTTRDPVNFDKTGGGFSLAALGDMLVAVYTVPSRPVDWATYSEAGLSVSKPGRLYYQVYAGGSPLPARNLATAGVTGDPHAVEAFGKLFVAFPTERGYSVFGYRTATPAGSLQIAGAAVETGAPSSHPTLVRTTNPDELYLFVWDEATKRVRQRKVIASATSAAISLGPVTDLNMNFGDRATPITSNGPVGGTWNSKIERIVLVATEPGGGFQGRMKMIQLGRVGEGWYGQVDRPVGGTSLGATATLSRPSVLFDGRPSAGVTGQYLIYNQWERRGSDAVPTELIRLTPAITGDIWTKQLIQNQWTTTRSAPSATLYRDDIAWGWRVDEVGFPEVPNMLQVFLRASGITDSGITDFDDVTWIATRGLRESLQSAPRR